MTVFRQEQSCTKEVIYYKKSRYYNFSTTFARDREPDLLPHFSVHNLRHTFCTRLCESTNDVKFIQQVMGHADFSTTMDIYTHITQENMQEKAKNISVNMKLM